MKDKMEIYYFRCTYCGSKIKENDLTVSTKFGIETPICPYCGDRNLKAFKIKKVDSYNNSLSKLL
jgi:DNA-directed RNA polymerase subunit RPC12/RpoP